ncbi:MAG: hypothetical protein EXS05_15990 [Planctomycetaceae bacterium]|nr:hypothetical protein [Planctomycetaceae bacterium]
MTPRCVRCCVLFGLTTLFALGPACGRRPLSAAPPPRNLSVSSEITEAHVLSQNWSDEESRWFYNVAQGSKLIPYAWFMHLEQPGAQTLFRDSEHFRSLGYLPRTPDALGNPDGLAIGFVKDGMHLGMTCAACHTGQVNYKGKAWLIDGGPTLGDGVRLQFRLVDALDETLKNTAKFERFVKGVLGSGATATEKVALKDQVQKVLDFRKAYNQRNMPGPRATPFGPGRVDAFGAIMNEIATTFCQVPDNHAPADAPVSYPFVWDAPQHDRVQWNGAIENKVVPLLAPLIGTPHVGALSRNTGEVLGVFGSVDATREGSLLQLRSYPSTANREHLIEIEDSLRKLWSPQWPKELPPIDPVLRTAGGTLFEQHCQTCHAPIQRDAADRQVTAQMRAVGTDQTMAANFASRQAKTGVVAGRKVTITRFRRLGPVEPAKDLLVHMVERVIFRPSPGIGLLNLTPDDLLNRIHLFDPEYPVFAEVKVGDRKLSGAFDRINLVNGKVHDVLSRHALRIAEAARIFRQDLAALDDTGRFEAADGETIELDQWSAVEHKSSRAGTQLTFAQPATVDFAYKGRPLNGIWATAPYLHNGSVPNLDELLKPSGQRVKQFKLGSREIDPEHVGYRVDQGDFTYDTTLKGNSNAGHDDYGREFTELERRQLIEYMKSL